MRLEDGIVYWDVRSWHKCVSGESLALSAPRFFVMKVLGVLNRSEHRDYSLLLESADIFSQRCSNRFYLRAVPSQSLRFID